MSVRPTSDTSSNTAYPGRSIAFVTVKVGWALAATRVVIKRIDAWAKAHPTFDADLYVNVPLESTYNAA